jgi:tripartite-type tricarboxylate transporter receptor subunit TctC
MGRARHTSACLAAVVAALSLAAGVLAGSGRAQAGEVADFYRGKIVHLVTGSSVGGGYDVYVRLFAEFARRHLPGEPTLIVQNRVGASGITAMDYVYNVAPKDGTTIIMPFNVDPLFQLVRPEGRKFDLSKVQWLGNMAELSNALVVTRAAGVGSIEEVRAKEVIMTSSSDGSQTSIVPKLFNSLMGTRFKVITGYKGTGDMMLSMQRGETQGRVGSWFSFKTSEPEGLRSGQLVVLAQDGIRRQPDLPDVRLYDEIVTDPQHKRMMRIMSYPVATSRALAVAPGVPPPRVAALRAAFAATMSDPGLVAAAKARNMIIATTDHAQIERLIADLFASPPELIARVRDVMNVN